MLHRWLAALAWGPFIALALPLAEHTHYPAKGGQLERRAGINIKDMFPEFDPKEHSNEQSLDAAQTCLEKHVGGWLDSPTGILGASIQDIIDHCQVKHGYRPHVEKLPQAMKEELQKRATDHYLGGGKKVTKELIDAEPDPQRRRRLELAREYQEEHRKEAEEWYGFPPEGEPRRSDDDNNLGRETQQPSQFSLQRPSISFFSTTPASTPDRAAAKGIETRRTTVPKTWPALLRAVRSTKMPVGHRVLSSTL